MEIVKSWMPACAGMTGCGPCFTTGRFYAAPALKQFFLFRHHDIFKDDDASSLFARIIHVSGIFYNFW